MDSPYSKVYEPRKPQDTLLYKTVAENLETFIAQSERDSYRRGWPEYVKKEFRGFLKCGVLAYGFSRYHCSGCRKDILVGHSCKNRGFCPSCCGRRMAESAAELTDNILPRRDVRQWVLSLPFPLRYWCASSSELTAKVHDIAAKTIGQFLKQQAAGSSGYDRKNLHAGAVCFVQRFGSALNLNPHLHFLVIEGVWLDKGADFYPKFIATPPPTDMQIELVVARIAKRVIRMLKKQGYLDENEVVAHATGHDPMFDDEPQHARAMSASIKYMIAFGPRAGQKLRTVKTATAFGLTSDRPETVKQRCAKVNGFSLHADVRVRKSQRDKLEKLVRYTARGPFSHKRLSQAKDETLLYELKTPWGDGTTHVKLSPLELLEKLAALIPPPRFHMFRYSGVLAPNSKLRSRVILKPPKPKQNHAEEEDEIPEQTRMSWSALLKRTFGIDMSRCPSCGSKEFRFVAAIEDPKVCSKILGHIGLDPIPPPIAPADLFELEEYIY